MNGKQAKRLRRRAEAMTTGMADGVTLPTLPGGPLRGTTLVLHKRSTKKVNRRLKKLWKESSG